ncbi:MAG TPA: response regulator [Verrucomicrobiae bacterium]|nr:response regulator [Verrucomicrobiae bacterium]
MKPCVILLVEDDANDAFFVERALNDLGFDGKVEHVTDTQVARAYVGGEGKYGDRAAFPFPDIVISDSALSGRGSGIDLLEWMRKEPQAKEVPFVILSGEVTPQVRQRAEQAGVQLILQKGSNFRDTARVLREALLKMPEDCRPWLK